MWQFILFSVLTVSATAPFKTKEVDKEAVLERHNYYRNLVGVEDLQYSEECAEYAQEWAEKLASKDRGLYHSKTNKYGENIFWASYATDEKEAIDDWASEREFFNTRKRTYTPKTGHYTQMIWRDTKFVGVGVAIAADGGEYWVATYYPPGNYVKQKAY